MFESAAEYPPENLKQQLLAEPGLAYPDAAEHKDHSAEQVKDMRYELAEFAPIGTQADHCVEPSNVISQLKEEDTSFLEDREMREGRDRMQADFGQGGEHCISASEGDAAIVMELHPLNLPSSSEVAVEHAVSSIDVHPPASNACRMVLNSEQKVAVSLDFEPP